MANLFLQCKVLYLLYEILTSFIPSIDFGGQRQRYENKLATFRRQAEERQDLQLRKEDAGEAGQEDQEDASTESSEVNDASPHFEIFKVISRDVKCVAVCHTLHLIH
jgi:hypothetical protein